jgi:hypothetical protein
MPQLSVQAECPGSSDRAMVVLQSKVRQSHFHHGKAAALIMGQVITIYMAWLKGAGNENAHRRLLHQADLAASRLGSKQTWQQADLAASRPGRRTAHDTRSRHACPTDARLVHSATRIQPAISAAGKVSMRAVGTDWLKSGLLSVSSLHELTATVITALADHITSQDWALMH